MSGLCSENKHVVDKRGICVHCKKKIREYASLRIYLSDNREQFLKYQGPPEKVAEQLVIYCINSGKLGYLKVLEWHNTLFKKRAVAVVEETDQAFGFKKKGV